ncbi:MAG: hypothetical protein IJV43_01815 [Oscillospiraceae bacterium]|nr:hypothetical protein [Oscillospiraceae bacterium]
MKRLTHIAAVLLALFVMLGVPTLAYVDFSAVFGGVDAVSRASLELPEQPSGNFVILLNRDKHPGTAEAWETFFSGGETDVIMDDVACLAAQGDAGGVQLAERFQARLAENQMTVKQVNPTLLASRADAGVYDVAIVSAEMAEALTLSTAYERAETSVIAVQGGAT